MAIAMGVVGSASAADNFQAVRTGLAHDSIYSIDRSGDALWAVGGHGMVLRSVDNGGSWQTVSGPGDFAALGLTFKDGAPVMVGQAGKAFQSVDGNGNWQALDTGTDQRLLSIVSLSDGTQIAVGAFGTIIRRAPNSDAFEAITVDWQAIIADDFEPHLYDIVQTKKGSILISGEFGLILRSDDGGKSWSSHNSNDSSVFALHQSESGVVTGVGQAGYVISSKDDGKSWQTTDAGTSANLLGVSSSGGKLVVVGVRAVLSSNDGGRSWEALVNRDTERRWYQGITGVASDNEGRRFFAAGQLGQIVNF